MNRGTWQRWLAIGLLGLLLSLGYGAVRSISPGSTQAKLADPVAWVQTSQHYYQTGQFSAAAELLGQAVQFYKNANNPLAQAQTLRFWAMPLQALGQWDQAQVAVDEGLDLLTARLETPRQLRAQLLTLQGQGYLATGQTTLALESWQAAETDYNAVDDFEGVLGSQLNQATALQVLGFYRQARQRLNQLEAELEGYPNSTLKVKGLLSLGNLMRLQGEIVRSQRLLQTSLTLAQQLPHTSNASTDISQIHLSLANTYRILHARQLTTENDTATPPADVWQYPWAVNSHNPYEAALIHYQQSIEQAPSLLLKAQAQLNQLSLLTDTFPIRTTSKAEAQTANTLVAAIAAALPKLVPSRPVVYAQVNFAHSLMILAKSSVSSTRPQPLPDIESILSRAVHQARELRDERACSYALGTLGTWYEQHGQTQRAIAVTRSALAVAQSLGASDISYQWQWQLGRLLTPANRPAAIDQYTAAVDTLRTLRSDLVALNPDIQFEFRASVEPVYRQLVDLLLRDAIPDHLTQARDVIEALQLAELDNFFRDACARPREVNIDNLDPQSAILYPIVLPDRLEIILKLPGTGTLLHYTQPGVSPEELNQVVEKLLEQFRRRSSNPQLFKETSQQLYTWLIEPFETDLETALDREQSSIKTLTFVLDGTLRNIPMAALYDGHQYLVERFAIAVAPGLNLIEPKPLPRRTLNVLLAGAEDAPSFRGAQLAPLNNVPRELDGIDQTLPNSRRLENEAFLQDIVYQKINDIPFNVVHLATHGQFSADPDQTFIFDWQDRIPAKDIDDLLFLIDPQRAVKAPIELLILSACETATGDARAALGLAGIAIRAGARSTLASLWNINDASTAEFMVRFYQQLTYPDLNKAEALRNTQLAFLHDYKGTDYRRPYHWASFILVGNWL